MGNEDAAPRQAVRAATGSDHDRWRALFREYAHLGGMALSDDQMARVWSWVCGNSPHTRCLLATEHDTPVGLVHFRPFERPITASTGLWIDDLYVQRASRGRGIAGALIDAVRAEAYSDGHDVVRWTTRESNVGARKLYDRIAARAPVVVYNSEPLPR